MDVEQILESVGLNKKETKVYLACLKLGQEAVFKIAKKSGLKRPTVYFILEKLKEKGIVSVKQTRKATFYSAIRPSKLLLRLEQQRKRLEQVLPELETFYQEQPDRPQVQIFEGQQGVELVYREIMEYVKKFKEILYFGSVKHYFSPEYQEFFDMWAKGMKNKRYKAREILVRDEAKKLGYLNKIQANKNSNHQIRLFSKDIRFIENDNIIYGDKIAIVSLRKEVFVILIQSQNIAESYRNLFEFVWRKAEELK